MKLMTIFSVAFSGILLSGCMEPSEINQSANASKTEEDFQPNGITQKKITHGFVNDSILSLSPKEIEKLKPGHLEYLKLVEEAKPKVSQGLAKAATYHNIGLLERTGYTTCTGNDLIRISMDDESDGNGSSVFRKPNSGSTWYQIDQYPEFGVKAVSGEDTEFRFCKINGIPSSALPAKYDYAFLRLESSCPSGTYPFARFIDNEDVNNQNSNSGNISPSTQAGSGTHGWTRLEFCFVPGNGSSAYPHWQYFYAVIGAKAEFSGSCHHNGYVISDDEDNNNINYFDWYGMSQTNIDKVSAFFWETPHTTYFYANYCDGSGG